jgi:transcriptional regulator with XRE-family HTH domain
VSQTELADALGSSRRTIIRRERGQSYPVDDEVRQLADLVRSEDEDLADELLAARGLLLDVTDEVTPATPDVSAPPQVSPAMAAKYSIDAVLYAAADAIDAIPRDVKPAIVAAFVRAKELGLTIDQVVSTLKPTK